MKLWILTIFVALGTSGPAMAASGAESCVAQSKHVKLIKRNAFIKSCMERLSSSSKENAQRNKKVSCEQNAKNKGLKGSAKDSYMAECLHTNQAAAVMTQSKQEQSLSLKEKFKKTFTKGGQKSDKGASSSRQSTKSCSRQAAKMKLHGSAYKKFMKRCQKD